MLLSYHAAVLLSCCCCPTTMLLCCCLFMLPFLCAAMLPHCQDLTLLSLSKLNTGEENPDTSLHLNHHPSVIIKTKTLEKRDQTHLQHLNPHPLSLSKLNTGEESPDTPSTFKSSPFCHYPNQTLENRAQTHLQHLNPHPSVMIQTKHWKRESRHTFNI